MLKSGGVFLCARLDGDVRADAVSGEGLYVHDTRYLSELRLSFGGPAPVALSHSVESGHRGTVHSTNPDLIDARGQRVPRETIGLQRSLLVADRLHCRIALRNFHARRVALPLVLTLAADFADLFEIRGVHERDVRGRSIPPRIDGSDVVFGYEGQDGVLRETRVAAEPGPLASEVDGESVRLRWEIDLPARSEANLAVVATPATGTHRPPARRFDDAARELDEDRDRWIGRCTGIETGSDLLGRVIDASIRDMHALLTPFRDRRIPAAGIPWYVAPFGRDALITAFECLLLDPVVARDTLLGLAEAQAETDDAWRDAEPGKILHELRSGELANAGLVPHTPYYGTVDATPLFLMLAAAYHRWSADLETMSALRPALDAALGWIDRYGDADGDGFVEYRCRSSAGLPNQGWKDSDDSIVHADGSLAEGPIALVEVQGYVYAAKVGAADVFEALGQGDRARALRAQAQALRDAFNEAFWMPEEGTFALALDGRKRQVASVASNAGHCLYSGIAEPGKAARVAERLMAPDMFSGWGIRTLSSQSPAYNPMSYHNGSVWPHDNAIIAAGLKRYGAVDATLRIATGLFEIASRARDFRLAELYCGFERSGTGEIVGYPVACVPQAWAAAAPFLLLQAMLGISPSAPDRTLGVAEPRLPGWLEHVVLRGLRVGDAGVSLAFTRTDEVTGFAVLDQRGGLAITESASPGTARWSRAAGRCRGCAAATDQAG